jgi:exopolyphosphatase/guanosine-5'-triphosphate,3'-diphosphate pyrophosphatase
VIVEFATRSEATGSPLAAVDIGTNSVHLVVAQPIGTGRFEILDREKESVRLGSGSGDMKTLAPDAIERGVDALTRFAHIAQRFGAPIRAVATSAVREAENRADFLDRVESETGIEIEVISGVEEARLIHLGVLQAVPVLDRRVLVIDIGGGSTEFVVGEGGEVLDALSLKLGHIRLTERFFGDEPVRKRQVTECRQYVRAYLAQVSRAVDRHGFEVAVGSSGTVVNLAEMVRAASGDAPLKTVNNFRFTDGELSAVVDSLFAARTAARRRAVPGLDPDRADVILGGSLILAEAFDVLAIPEMRVSDYALREGVLLDALARRERHSPGGDDQLGDLRRRSVEHLAAIAPGERAHAEHATRLALSLFDATTELHGLGQAYEELLEAAGRLANVGLFISHSGHHQHSYYIIRNSDLLVGFTDHEIEIIALVARYHRKSTPKARHPEFARLSEADQHAVRVLAGFLRIAIALDRGRQGIVKEVRVRTARPRSGPGKLVIQVDAGDEDPSLELYTADQRKGLLEEAIGVEIRLVRVGGHAAGEDGGVQPPEPLSSEPARPRP